jgi:hypothetical protein
LLLARIRHVEQTSLAQQRLEIEKLLLEKARAETRLEMLERDHIEALAARGSAFSASVNPGMLPAPRELGTITTLASVEQYPGLQTSLETKSSPVNENSQATAGASAPVASQSSFSTPPQEKTSKTEAGPKTVDISHTTPTSGLSVPTSTVPSEPEVTTGSATCESESSTVRGDLGGSRAHSDCNKVNGLLQDEPEAVGFMINLHDDYTACLRQLQMLQSHLEQALHTMYIPSATVPVMDQDLDASTRREMIASVEKSARQTSDCLERCILESNGRRNSNHNQETSKNSKPAVTRRSLIVEMYEGGRRRMGEYATKVADQLG